MGLSCTLDVTLDRTLDRRLSGLALSTELLVWPLETSSGLVIPATAGPAGTLSADQWGASGIVGTYAIDLNLNQGDSDSTITFGSTVVSLGFWLKSSSLATAQVVYASSADTSGGGYFLVEFDTNDLKVSLIKVGGSRVETYSMLPHSGRWVHVGLVLDSAANGGTGEIKVYINGVLRGTTIVTNTRTGGGTFPSSTIRIGSDLVDVYNGLMDDFRIYSDERSASDFQSMVVAGKVHKNMDGTPRLEMDGNVRQLL